MAAHCRSIIVFSLVFAGLVDSGCVSFRDSKLQRYEAGVVISSAPPITVQFDARTIMPVPERYGRVNMQKVEIRTQLLEESHRLFSQAGIQTSDDASTNLRFVVTLYVYPEGLSSLPRGYYLVFSTLTCLILPIHEQEAWVLGVDIEKSGQLLKQYQYRQVIHTWAELMLIFALPFYDIDVLKRKAMDDLLFNFILDFQRDHARFVAK